MSKKKGEHFIRKKTKSARRSRKYYQNLSPEMKEKVKQRNREYNQKLNPIQMEKMKQRQRKYNSKIKLNPEKMEQRNLKQREYDRKRYLNMNAEKREERRRKAREYYRKLSPEQLQKRRQYALDYIRNKALTEKCQKMVDLKTYLNFKKNTIIEGFHEDVKQGFCYTCQMQFVKNSALFKHIIKHVTLPSIILTRIDKHKFLHTIKIEKENTQINSSLFSEKTQSVIHIKTENTEYDEDTEREFNNIHMGIKTETDIEIDDVTFYSRIKKELD